MKLKFVNFFIIFLFTFGLITFSPLSEAYRCRWVPGHWYHRHWVPGHKVCWHRVRHGRHYHRYYCHH